MSGAFINFIAHLDRFGKKAVRFGIVVVFLWIGGLKFFTYEADGIVPFVANSPFMSFFYAHPAEYKKYQNKEGELIPANHAWHTENNTYGFAYGLGALLVLLAIGVALYRVMPLASMVASILIFIMTLGTLSFLITTPESWVPHLTDTDWGFPFLSGRGRLVIKDIVILGGAIVTMSESATLYLQRKNDKNDVVHYNTINAGGVNIFYREAGPKDAPVVLLMHGYPTSSFMFRNLIPMLSKQYHVIAPDLPGFGFSDAPPREAYHYTFDQLTRTMQAFIDTLGLKRFAIYVFDYGAPVGFRLALANPEKITGIISQNGNAYEQGLLDWSDGLVKAYWDNDTKANRDALRKYFTLEGINFQYRTGVASPSLIAPETIYLDNQLMERPGNVEIQLDLILDYRTNVKLYPDFQAYFRKYQPKLLAVWGSKDPYFSPAGAEGFKRDDPNAVVQFYDTGHFALETHGEEIGQAILAFLPTLPE